MSRIGASGQVETGTLAHDPRAWPRACVRSAFQAACEPLPLPRAEYDHGALGVLGITNSATAIRQRCDFDAVAAVPFAVAALAPPHIQMNGGFSLARIS